MTRATARAALLVLAVGGFQACTPKLPVERPVRVLGTEREIVLLLTSEPSGATVYELGPDGQAGAIRGTTPIELDRLKLAKELWKFSEGHPPPDADECVACLEKRRTPRGSAARSLGDGWTASLLLQSPGRKPTTAHLELRGEDLPVAYSRGVWTLHVVLEETASP